MLGTDPAGMGELVRRIAARRTWPKGRRPHGVLALVAEGIEGIEGDTLVLAGGGRIGTRGAISVFGPGRGAQRRGPFVIAVLVASPDGQQPLAPSEAYAHPCWSATDMLPVDSSHECRCLDILVRFQGWMAAEGCQVAIAKPLYDRSGYYLGQEAGDAVIKPDFEGAIQAANGGFLRSFAVEVMGYDHPEYRAGKVRVKAAITGKRVHFLEHLAHDPARMEEHDRTFRSSLTQLGRRAISKARDVPALPAAPIRPTLMPTATPAMPNRPIQPLAVPRTLMPMANSPAPARCPTLTPGQPEPARAAAAPLPLRPVPPTATLPPGPAYPQTSTAPGTPSSPRPDPGQAASPGPGRSGLAQRLLRHLRLRR